MSGAVKAGASRVARLVDSSEPSISQIGHEGEYASELEMDQESRRHGLSQRPRV